MPKIVDREEMQRGILDAAMRVFSQRGYHAATIADVAEAAGLGKGTLYLYFKNKEAIAEATVQNYFARMEEHLMSPGPPADLNAFISSLDRAMDVPEDQANFIRVFFEVFGPSFASETFAGSVAALFEKLGARYAEDLAHLQAQGHIRAGIDPKLLGRSLASLIDGMTLHFGLFGLPPRRYTKMRRETLEMFLKGMHPDNAR